MSPDQHAYFLVNIPIDTIVETACIGLLRSLLNNVDLGKNTWSAIDKCTFVCLIFFCLAVLKTCFGANMRVRKPIVIQEQVLFESFYGFF